MIEHKSMELNLPELMSVEATEAPDVFVGKAEPYGRLGIYGGHFLGQALAAGFRTVEEPKVAQSFHAYFLNPGDPEADIIYRVSRLKEGRGADMRSISAEQNGRASFHMIASYKIPEEGDEHQPVMPDVISPEALEEKLAAAGRQFQPPMMNKNRATLMQITESFVPDEFKPGREPNLQTWMKSNHEGEVSARAAQCALAFLSDGTLMFNSVVPYGIPFATHRLTSLDHSVWFHRACDVGDWLMFDQASTAAADGRGMNEGRIYDRSGKLIATAAQDSMLRRMPQG
ncbi:MAG: acyl-CoA thioesterase-2 [Patiriisocius sp.]|jgi:acyl-CoA thioesterase-2